MRYERYRKTGIPWLPEVPEEWEVRRIKVLFYQRKERNDPIKTANILSLTAVQGVVPVSEKIGAGGNKPKDDLTQYDLAYPGDLILNCMNVVAGSVGVSNYFGAISPVYYALVAKSCANVLYYNYIFQMKSFQRSLLPLGKGILMHESSTGKLNTVRLRISMNALSGVKLPFPSLDVQKKIASFLDEKCGKVDRLVAAKQKEVSLLKELKQSMIADAVTGKVECGVRSAECGAGDFNAEAQRRRARREVNLVKTNRPTKPSGIPWLPEVPEGWEVRKIKYLFKERSEKGHPEETPLCSTQAYGVIPQSLYENRVVATNKDGLALQKLVKVGDFVISLRAFQGGIEIAHYQGIISAAYTILEPLEPNFAPYFRWLFKAHPFIELLKTCVTGIREGQNINYQLLARKFIPLPPLPEQKAIVAYIETRAAKIDAAVAKLEAEVAALKEYRERLIADVVTGQRRVA